jgi:hypothetical protein
LLSNVREYCAKPRGLIESIPGTLNTQIYDDRKA